jgi:predicted nucleic acid-binding protein
VSPGHFLDTNILLYSISRDPAEAGKRKRAIELLDRDDGALSIQVLQEFYVQATRANRTDAVPHDIAVGLMHTWTRFAIQDITLSVFRSALEIKGAHGFSYRDSAIIAAAIAIGCRTLYSEDMMHGRVIEDVTICNPFR